MPTPLCSEEREAPALRACYKFSILLTLQSSPLQTLALLASPGLSPMLDY